MMKSKYKPKYFLKFILFSFLFLGVCITSFASDGIEEVGTYAQFVLPAAALSVIWVKKDGAGFEQFLMATMLAEGVTFVLKPTINEQRPNGGDQSFPSGHTMITSDAATFLWRRYGPWYGVPASIVAAFTGYSRVESKHHYWHDVFAGAAIGIAANLIFTKKYSIDVGPVDGGGAELTVSCPL